MFTVKIFKSFASTDSVCWKLYTRNLYVIWYECFRFPWSQACLKSLDDIGYCILVESIYCKSIWLLKIFFCRKRLKSKIFILLSEAETVVFLLPETETLVFLLLRPFSLFVTWGRNLVFLQSKNYNCRNSDSSVLIRYC